MKKFFIFIFIFSTRCGVDNLTSNYLSIDMQAVYEEPATATGSLEPFFETYTLQSIKLVNATSQDVVLYDGKPITLRVNTDRLSVLKKKLTSTLWNQNYGKLVVVFAKAIKGQSKKEHDLTLASGEVAYELPFAITQGKDISFLIKIKWKSTVVRDMTTGDESIELPELTMVLE